MIFRHRCPTKLNFGDSVKSGSDLTDIWRRMLLEIKPCTESVANAIIQRYPSYRALVDGYSRLGSQKACETLLQDIQVFSSKFLQIILLSFLRVCFRLKGPDARVLLDRHCLARYT